jgi:hypothetical protein
MLAEEFERRYLELFWERQHLQWENYVADAGHNLSAVDARIYTLVVQNKDRFELPGRQGQVLDAIIDRELVDKHPQVTQLRNRLDDWENYAAGLSEAKKRDPAHYRLALARRMKPDVLRLMQLRQRLARELGFPSYVELVLGEEGLASRSLITLLEKCLEDHLVEARELIQAHQLTGPTWFSGLSTIGRIEQGLQPTKIVDQFLERMGFGALRGAIRIHAQPQPIAGYAGILSIPDDIRILIQPVITLQGWLVLFHELGHAIAHALNTATGLFTTWTSAHDETMAELMARIAALVLLDEDNQRAARQLFLLETTRCAVSALFEFELWEHPEAAERLYTQHYRQLGFDIADPEIWALDSFRSIDPVYIHNYVIGSVVAEKTVDHLCEEYGQDFHRWGEWLRSNYFADGRRCTLQDKTAAIDGFI